MKKTIMTLIFVSVQSFHKYLLRTYCAPDPVSSAGGRCQTRQRRSLSLWSFYSRAGEPDDKQVNEWIKKIILKCFKYIKEIKSLKPQRVTGAAGGKVLFIKGSHVYRFPHPVRMQWLLSENVDYSQGLGICAHTVTCKQQEKRPVCNN